MIFENFYRATLENPEIFDFYDIFNNKILENMTIVIHRQILRRLSKLSKSLESLISQMTYLKKNKVGLTVSLQNFIENSIKNKKLLNDGIINTRTSENNSVNYFLQNKISQKDKTSTSLTNPQKNENCNHSISKRINEDKSIFCFDAPNKDRDIDSLNTQKMFSVSRKINNPLFIDDEEDDILISDDEDMNSETSEDVKTQNTDKSTLLKDNNSKNNEDNNNKRNMNFDMIKNKNKASDDYKETILIKENVNIHDKNKPTTPKKMKTNIQVNNFNNINNINIVSTDISSQLKNLNNLNSLNFIEKNTPKKFNPNNIKSNYNIGSKFSRSPDSINGILTFPSFIFIKIFKKIILSQEDLEFPITKKILNS